MTRALKVIMVIFGAVLILEGLADIVVPEQRVRLMGVGESASYVMFYMTILGATWIAAGFWVVAAGRDPLRHIYWVKFVITLPILLSVILVYSVIKGYVSFDKVVIDLVMDIVFTLALLILYPWRVTVR